MEHQETAVAIEKDIEELNRFNKFDQFITLSTYYHVNWCELGINCKKCDFVLNLRYLYVENVVNGYITNVEKLQNYCRLDYVNFYFLRVMLHSLAAVERQKRSIKKFDKQFETILHLWNVKNIKLSIWTATKKN